MQQHKELILVAQDLTRYGSDLTGKAELLPLLEKLSRLDINKIRLMYCYPELVTNELIDYINDEPKIAKYIDMPMQHIDSAVLKRMNRPANEETIRARLDYIKSKSSNISIRSTFMVGFPGETDNEFGKMVSFLEEYQLDNVGFFGFSKEDGTAAALMKDQISARVKADRLSYVTAVQSRIMADKLDKCINSDVMVTYDDIDYCKQLFCGHTERNAPEVDKKVYFSSKIPLEIGREYKVTLKSRKKLDMYGVIVEENK